METICLPVISAGDILIIGYLLIPWFSTEVMSFLFISSNGCVIFRVFYINVYVICE